MVLSRVGCHDHLTSPNKLDSNCCKTGITSGRPFLNSTMSISLQLGHLGGWEPSNQIAGQAPMNFPSISFNKKNLNKAFLWLQRPYICRHGGPDFNVAPVFDSMVWGSRPDPLGFNFARGDFSTWVLDCFQGDFTIAPILGHWALVVPSHINGSNLKLTSLWSHSWSSPLRFRSLRTDLKAPSSPPAKEPVRRSLIKWVPLGP